MSSLNTEEQYDSEGSELFIQIGNKHCKHPGYSQVKSGQIKASTLNPLCKFIHSAVLWYIIFHDRKLPSLSSNKQQHNHILFLIFWLLAY